METGFNPKRRLCPDGSCVGLIGPDGRCTVCARSADASAEVDDDRAAATGDSAPADGFDPARRLCDDGSCVGVIGADGVCGTCGRKAE